MAELIVLKICTLTPAQEEYVRSNYNRMSIGEMSRNIQVNQMKIGRNMRFLGLVATLRARPKTKVIEMDTTGFFNVDNYAKQFAI